MRKIAISGESTMDVKANEAVRLGLHNVPFHIQMGENSYLDGTEECSCKNLFEFTERTGILPKTSAVNVDELERHFEALLQEYDEIIHFTISSKLSSGYVNAVAAAKGDPRIHIVDSKSISLMIYFQARYAQKLIEDESLSIDEIIQKVYEYQNHIQGSLLIDKLDYMHKGGRCSKVTLLGANLLRIKPAIVVTDEGELTVGKKFRGKLERTVADYLTSTLDSYEDIDLSYAALAYTVTPKEVVDMAYQILVDFGFKEIYLTETNATDASHGGPNVVGFVFSYGKKKASKGLLDIFRKDEDKE